MSDSRRHGKVSILASLGEAFGISSRRDGGRNEERTHRLARTSSQKQIRSASPRGFYGIELYPQRRSHHTPRRSRLVSSSYPSEFDIRGTVSSDEDSGSENGGGTGTDSDNHGLKEGPRNSIFRNDTTTRKKESTSGSSTLGSRSSRSGNYRLTTSDISHSTFSVYEDSQSVPRRVHNPLPREEFQKAVAEFKKDYNRKLEDSKTTKAMKKTKKETSGHVSTGSTRQPLAASCSAGNHKAKVYASDDETIVDDNDSPIQEQSAEGRSRSSLMLDGHFCMGCGIRRALKHQVERAQKSDDVPWKNLCRPCLKKYCDGSKYAMDEFGHLCWGCGFARSAHFHRQHPVGNDENPVPNICSFCRLQKRNDSGKSADKVPKPHSSINSQKGVTPNIAAELPNTRQPRKPATHTNISPRQTHKRSPHKASRPARRRDQPTKTSISLPSSIYKQPTVESESGTSDIASQNTSTASKSDIDSGSDALPRMKGNVTSQVNVDHTPTAVRPSRHDSPLIDNKNLKGRRRIATFFTPAPNYNRAFQESEHIRRQTHEQGASGPAREQHKTSTHTQQQSHRTCRETRGFFDPFIDQKVRGRASNLESSEFVGTHSQGFQPRHYTSAPRPPSKTCSPGLGNTYQEKQRIARERAHFYANMGAQRSASQQPLPSDSVRGPARPQQQHARPSTSGCDGRAKSQDPRVQYTEPSFYPTFSRRGPVLPETGFVEELLPGDEPASPGSTQANVGLTTSVTSGHLVRHL